jgi:hypothetical protein
MDITLFISFAIIAAGLLAAFYFTKLDAFLDNLLKGLGQMARNILKYSLYGLFALLGAGSVYSVFQWATTGVDPTPQQVVGSFVSDADRAADYVGNLINGDSNSSPSSATDSLNRPAVGGVVTSGTLPTGSQYDLRPAPANAALLAWESNRGLTLDAGVGSECSRHIKDSGNCGGISRFFRDDLMVRAPQLFRTVSNVNFPL